MFVQERKRSEDIGKPPGKPPGGLCTIRCLSNLPGRP
jgi:hypothetical protein